MEVCFNAAVLSVVLFVAQMKLKRTLIKMLLSSHARVAFHVLVR